MAIRLSNKRRTARTGNLEYHAGVITKSKGEWYILDTAEDNIIRVVENSKELKEWLKGVVYLSFVTFNAHNPPREYADAFLREWELILSGKMILKRGPPSKPRMSPRNYTRKDFRRNFIGKGDT